MSKKIINSVLLIIICVACLNISTLFASSPQVDPMSAYLSSLGLTLEQVLSTSSNIIYVDSFDDSRLEPYLLKARWVEGPVAWYLMEGRRCFAIRNK